MGGRGEDTTPPLTGAGEGVPRGKGVPEVGVFKGRRLPGRRGVPKEGRSPQGEGGPQGKCVPNEGQSAW